MNIIATTQVTSAKSSNTSPRVLNRRIDLDECVVRRIAPRTVERKLVGGRPTSAPAPEITLLNEIAGWIAPVATAVAAIMTAANLGARITGWGFVVFTIGSLAWSTVAVGTGQTNLLWTNSFLTLANLIGIWRWLGREARRDDGRDLATKRSATAREPTLFGMGAIVGATLTGRDGTSLGTVVDGMLRCDGADIAYLVVGEGGLAGFGERLHAIDARLIRFTGNDVTCDLTANDLCRLPILTPEKWPMAVDAWIADAAT